MADSQLQRYTDFFEQLNADNLSELDRVMTEDIHFVDPFNDVIGIDKVQKIFRHMYDNLENPQFRVTHGAIADGDADTAEKRGLIRWELRSLLNGKPYKIVGMSELGFSEDGRVNEHIDHWDASQQFYARLPVIGWLLGLVRARLKA
jgi:steroid delta-isomerase